MKDLRDGQTYKTVQIGDQVWMAENLNYKAENTYCLNNRDTNCTKYGRFYMWGTAMDSAGTWGTNGKGCGYDKPCSPKKSVRGVCPEGWHLPSYFEWKRLIVTVDDSITEYDDENAAATKLKSASGWADGGNGDDSYSFSALPSGYLSYDGYFNFEGKETHFWSSGTQGDMWVFCMVLYSNDLDAMVQGVVDNESFLSKPGWELQVSPDEQKSLEARYEQAAKDREALGENARPVVLAGPITGGKVVLTDTTAPIVKYSYLQGVQIDLEFAGMRKAFDEPFETHYFIMGLRESVMGAIDPSFKKSVSDATLKAVNARFVERMEKIRKEQRGQ